MSRTYYSVGGGFVVDETATGADRVKVDDTKLRFPFSTAAELLDICHRENLSISAVMMENEKSWRSESEIRERLLFLWRTMQDCVKRGCEQEGMLPGGMKVRRRAAELYRDKAAWRRMQRRGMTRRVGWARAAEQYAELYQSALADRAPG